MSSKRPGRFLPYFCLFGILMLAQTAQAQGNYAISASPTAITVAQGNQGTSTITSTVSGGFNNPVTLAATLPNPKIAVTFGFSPNPIPAPGSGSSSMTVSVGSSVTPGVYPIIVTSSGGGIHKVIAVILTVTAQQQPSFTISASPASLTITQGNQGSTTIVTTGLNGFNSAISLSATGAPSNTSVSFSPNPIPAPGSGRSTMSIVVGSNTPTGTYPITVTGNGGGTQQSTTVSLTVTSSGGSLAVSVVPPVLNVPQANQITGEVITAISGGFNGAVTLTSSGAPLNTTISFAPATIPAPGAGITTMTIVVGSTTAPGSYTVTVTASSGNVQQTATFTLNVVAQSGEPFPARPRLYIDTTWNPPNGTTWNVNTASSFQNALNQAAPGDTIVLDDSVTYSGNFTLPTKTNPSQRWIYIETSGLSNLSPPGTRVNPTVDEQYMAKITSPNTGPAITINAGASYYRLVGLEVTTNSNQGCNLGNNPPVNCFTYFLIYPTTSLGGQLADSITVDRNYIHGSPTQDVREGVTANATNFAVIDSYISDIHQSTNDSQGIIAYFTPGPIKIVNNYISATTEDVMFGGAGGYNNPYVPSDIELRRNHFYKPLSWDEPGITLPPNAEWVVKDNLEFKSGQRAWISGNILENDWLSGQQGYSVDLTVRTSQSGNIAVVDDITMENNVLTNVDAGWSMIETDDECGAEWGYPNCTNPGESKRWKIYNNLLLMSPANDGSRHVAFSVGTNQTDLVFQHNTVLVSDGSTCTASFYFNSESGWGWPPPQSYTHNLWMLDSALCRQPTGDWGQTGTAGMTYYMGDPPPLQTRLWGDVMFVPSGDHVATWPAHNDATTTPFTYVNPNQGNYQLLTPDWTDTTDGKISGIDYNALEQAQSQ